VLVHHSGVCGSMYDQSPPMIVCILLIAANQRHAMGPWRNRTLNHVKSEEWSKPTAAAVHHHHHRCVYCRLVLITNELPYMSLLATTPHSTVCGPIPNTSTWHTSRHATSQCCPTPSVPMLSQSALQVNVSMLTHRHGHDQWALAAA
jgi:hypothetical protein